MTIIKDVRNIDWSKSEGKRKCDELSYSQYKMDLLARGAGASVLSTPAAGWRWESWLQSVAPHPLEFTGIERDRHVHYTAVRRESGPNFRMTTWPVSLGHYLKTAPPDKPFYMIYADWMGIWSAEKKWELSILFSNSSLLEVGGWLIFTVGLFRGGAESLGELRKYARRPLSITLRDTEGRTTHLADCRVQGIPPLVVATAATYGITLEAMAAFVYYSKLDASSHHCSPQAQFLFKRLA